MTQTVTLIDTTPSLGNDVDGLFLQHYQDIPTTFVDFLADKRKALAKERAGEYLHVASVPTIFVTKWLKEGLNVYTAPVKDVIKRIREEDLEAFLVTEKAI